MRSEGVEVVTLVERFALHCRDKGRAVDALGGQGGLPDDDSVVRSDTHVFLSRGRVVNLDVLNRDGLRRRTTGVEPVPLSAPLVSIRSLRFPTRSSRCDQCAVGGRAGGGEREDSPASRSVLNPVRCATSAAHPTRAQPSPRDGGASPKSVTAPVIPSSRCLNSRPYARIPTISSVTSTSGWGSPRNRFILRTSALPKWTRASSAPQRSSASCRWSLCERHIPCESRCQGRGGASRLSSGWPLRVGSTRSPESPHDIASCQSCRRQHALRE